MEFQNITPSPFPIGSPTTAAKGNHLLTWCKQPSVWGMRNEGPDECFLFFNCTGDASTGDWRSALRLPSVSKMGCKCSDALLPFFAICLFPFQGCQTHFLVKLNSVSEGWLERWIICAARKNWICSHLEWETVYCYGL